MYLPFLSIGLFYHSYFTNSGSVIAATVCCLAAFTLQKKQCSTGLHRVKPTADQPAAGTASTVSAHPMQLPMGWPLLVIQSQDAQRQHSICQDTAPQFLFPLKIPKPLGSQEQPWNWGQGMGTLRAWQIPSPLSIRRETGAREQRPECKSFDYTWKQTHNENAFHQSSLSNNCWKQHNLLTQNAKLLSDKVLKNYLWFNSRPSCMLWQLKCFSATWSLSVYLFLYFVLQIYILTPLPPQQCFWNTILILHHHMLKQQQCPGNADF